MNECGLQMSYVISTSFEMKQLVIYLRYFRIEIGLLEIQHENCSPPKWLGQMSMASGAEKCLSSARLFIG